MTEAEIVQLLGGGKIGRKRYDVLRRRCRYQPTFGRCLLCERLFINFKFFYVPKGELRPAGFDGREGRWEHGRSLCLKCVPLEPAPSHSTSGRPDQAM